MNEFNMLRKRRINPGLCPEQARLQQLSGREPSSQLGRMEAARAAGPAKVLGQGGRGWDQASGCDSSGLLGPMQSRPEEEAAACTAHAGPQVSISLLGQAGPCQMSHEGPSLPCGRHPACSSVPEFFCF